MTKPRHTLGWQGMVVCWPLEAITALWVAFGYLPTRRIGNTAVRVPLGLLEACEKGDWRPVQFLHPGGKSFVRRPPYGAMGVAYGQPEAQKPAEVFWERFGRKFHLPGTLLAALRGLWSSKQSLGIPPGETEASDIPPGADTFRRATARTRSRAARRAVPARGSERSADP
jgi:hypothetical protein